jgi:hypothetical protein
MGRVIARVRAGVGSAPRVGRSARRCHSPGSGGANRLESSAGAMLGIPLSRRHVGGLLLAGPAGTIVGRSNTVSSGPLAWVMIHRHHAAERTGLGLDQNAWVSFGKQGWVNSRECRRVRSASRLWQRWHLAKGSVSASTRRMVLVWHGSGFGWRSGCVAGYLANRYHRVRTESKTRSAAWRVVIQIKFH